MDSDYLASGLLSNRQLTRLASRGGRNRSSTRLPVFGASIKKRGLAPAPFSIFKASFPVRPVVPPRIHGEFPARANPCFHIPSWSIAYQKMSGRWGERPLGRGD